jgi:predicted  nucleic acid-binding Zn ribbon protein
LDDEYRENNPDVNIHSLRNEKILKRALIVAEQNELLYPFLEKITEKDKLLSSKLSEIIAKENKRKLRFENTLKFIDSFFSKAGLDYMFIKLYRGIPYIPRDVDILIRREEKEHALSALKNNGITIRSFDDAEINIEIEGLFKVDLYLGFYYFKRPFIDNEFLWKSPRKVQICGLDSRIPNTEADFLILLIHSILGHKRFSLIDFLYAKKMLINNNLNFDELRNESEKFGWHPAFKRLVSFLENLYKMMYIRNEPINFPYPFSAKFILETFGSFEDLRIKEQTKCMFVASTLIDRAFYSYQLIQREIPLSLDPMVESLLLRFIRKVRYWSGDRKGIYG